MSREVLDKNGGCCYNIENLDYMFVKSAESRQNKESKTWQEQKRKGLTESGSKCGDLLEL